MQPLSQLRGKLWREALFSQACRQGIYYILYCCCFLAVLHLCLDETICIDCLHMEPTIGIALQNVHSLSEHFFPPVPELLTSAEDVSTLFAKKNPENKHVVIATNFMDFYEVIQALEKVAAAIRSLRSQLEIQIFLKIREILTNYLKPLKKI